MSFYDKFLNYIDSVISGNVERLQRAYSKLIKGTSLAQITLPDAAQVVKKDIAAVHNVFDAHNGALEKALESLRNESETANAIKAIEKQEENLLNVLSCRKFFFAKRRHPHRISRMSTRR